MHVIIELEKNKLKVNIPVFLFFFKTDGKMEDLGRTSYFK